MAEIAGLPYTEAQFDEKGALKNQVDLPAGITDLFVISHGWNNNADAARSLYRGFFESFAAVAQPNDLPGRKIAVVGVLWPSKKFDELVAVSGAPAAAGGAAGLGAADPSSLQALEAKIERMKETFDKPDQKQVLEEAKALLPDLDDKASARRAFVGKIRSLLDPGEAGREDASDSFFEDDGDLLMKNLKVDEEDLAEEIVGEGGGASLPLGVGAATPATGGAAGITDFLSGFKASAMNVLNYTTYYEMKSRAGAVGRNGVARLLDAVSPQVERIHLVGHSFGGRVVTAAAASSTTDKIRSMTLLQAAFSHNGFSKIKKGFFRVVVDNRRVNGPILVTHTKNDRAVGIAYPLASRLNGDKAAAFGDENDAFGGLGRNGVQQMEEGERKVGKLLATGSAYQFQPRLFFNLEASDFIKDHSDVTGKEVAHAARRAIA
jgi:predicted alpha/beta hydrolase family esterase